jgi:hypothetical protein
MVRETWRSVATTDYYMSSRALRTKQYFGSAARSPLTASACQPALQHVLESLGVSRVAEPHGTYNTVQRQAVFTHFVG